MAAQPFLFGPTWIPVKDGDFTGMALFLRHYTARASRKQFQFVGPGGKMVMLTPDARALFVWRKFISDAGEMSLWEPLGRIAGGFRMVSILF